MPQIQVISDSVAVVRNLFDEPIHRRFIAALDDEIAFLPQLEDPLFKRRAIHNPPIFSYAHRQLAAFASEMSGLALKPSYCFLSMYPIGGICPLHVDREQCVFTIDYLIRTDSKDAWPIAISEQISDQERQDAATASFDESQKEAIISSHVWNTINLQPNDAVLYSGTHSWHYRPAPAHANFDLVFFHFVLEGYDGPLD